MIASIAFRNFKALRNTQVALGPFNLVIGPNGSGKTSLIEAVMRLSAAASLPAHARAGDVPVPPSPSPRPTAHGGQELEFHFAAPYEAFTARLSVDAGGKKETMAFEPPHAPEWPPLRQRLSRARAYVLDHTTMAAPSPRNSGAELNFDGANVAAVLARIRDRSPEAFSGLTAEMLRIAPEFRSLELTEHADETVEVGLRLADNALVTPAEMSQGMLYLLSILALAFNPDPPAVLCLEDVDRGIHPRMLREVRDALYRLGYPELFGIRRPASQIVVTSHSPYFIDLFREHPEEVIISQKRGREARFERLADRPDLPELLREGALGDMWFSGILGGVPEEP